MTVAHFLYVPMVLMVGVLLGLVLGARAARNQMELQRRRDEERAAARAAREARKAERARAEAAPGGGDGGSGGGAPT